MLSLEHPRRMTSSLRLPPISEPSEEASDTEEASEPESLLPPSAECSSEERLSYSIAVLLPAFLARAAVADGRASSSSSVG